jgi:hypothetical protein
MNDDQSPLISLVSCTVCAKTMKLETIAPDGDGRDIIEYRCGQCGRIERLRLVRTSWPLIADVRAGGSNFAGELKRTTSIRPGDRFEGTRGDQNARC